MLTSTRELSRLRGLVIISGCALVGLILAGCVMVSPVLATLLLSSGAVLAISLSLRKVQYLIVGWICLTGFLNLLLSQLPASYYPIVGRAAFWGVLSCIIVAWSVDILLRGRGFVHFDNMPLKVILAIFLVWCTLSLSTAQNLFLSLKHVAHYVIVLFAAYMFYDFFSRDQEHITKTLRTVLYVTVIICFFIVLAGARGLISGTPVYKELSLWFQNPNGLGKLIATSIPILITAGIYHVHSRGLKLLFVSVILIGLLLTFSRASWLATSASIAFILWRGRMKTPIWAFIVAGLFLAAWLFPAYGVSAYNYISGPHYTGRKQIWEAAWNIACDYPLLGVGPGYSLYLVPQYCSNPLFGELIGPEETHNLLLANAAEMGFPSVAIWLAFFATFVYYSMRMESVVKSEHRKLMCRGATGTFVALFVSGIFENGCLLSAFSGSEYHIILPYLVMALPFAAKRLEEREGIR
ncbi:MAG: O-antigen ligase family protein [Thermodesulfobacteriota bacterium]|nr:O-antigen ligase family protein [Thermodesulfobacteriota bacterium]